MVSLSCRLLRQVASTAPPKPTVPIPCEQPIEGIAPTARNDPGYVNYPPQEAERGDYMNRRIGIGETPALIQNKEGRGIFGINAVFDQ